MGKNNKSYSSISSSIEDIDTALGGKRLCASYDSLGAVNHAPSARPFHELGRWRLVDG